MEHDCVLKFGGSSLGSHEEVMKCARLVDLRKRHGERIVVVVSAMGSTTDQLVALASSLDLDTRSGACDLLLASGEQIAAAAMALALKRLGHEAIPLSGGEAGIFTDGNHGRAEIIHLSTDRLSQELDRGCIPVVMGFQGTAIDGALTTLGRGGSDTTAVALAGALNRTCRPTRCEIYTDVNGVHSSDPRLVTGTRRLDSIDFGRMKLLAGMGAQVMAPRAVEHAERCGVPILISGCESPGQGTLIGPSESIEIPPGVLACALMEELGHVRLSYSDPTEFLPHELMTAMRVAEIDFIALNHQVGSEGQHVIECTASDDQCGVVADLLSAHVPIRSSGVQLDTRRGLASIGLVGCGFSRTPAPLYGALEFVSRLEVDSCPIGLDDRYCRILVDGGAANEMLQRVHDEVGLTVLPGFRTS